MKKPEGKNLFDNVFLTTWRPYSWIFFIGFLLYSQILFFKFSYFDDNILILDNYFFLEKLSNIFQAFKYEVFHILHSSAAYYRPVLTISFILDAQLGGVSPFIYHLTNLNIHLLVSCFLFLFLLKLGYERKFCLFFSLIFTVHPVLTQAVAWIPGRNDSLLALFVLLSFIFLLQFLETKKWNSYFFHLLFFLLALFTKESAFVLPFLIILYIYIINKNSFFNLKKLIIGWFILLVFWFILRKLALENPIEMSVLEMLKAIIFNFPAVIIYIGKIILPVNLSVLPILQDTAFIYGLIAIILLTAIILSSENKRNRFIVFGLLWFFLFLLPSFIRPNTAIVADFIEHRIYVPLIGFIIVLLETDIIKKLINVKKKLLVYSVCIICFSIITFYHTRNFKDRLSFWKNAARTSPHSPLAHKNLGAMYYLEGSLDEAENEYKTSLKLNPDEQMAHNNLGLIYMNKNMFKEAEEEYLKELTINPLYDNALFNLGILYYKQNKIKEAVELWKKTLEVNPDYIEAYHNLAFYYYHKPDFTKAVYYVRQLQKRNIKIHPKFLELVKCTGLLKKGE